MSEPNEAKEDRGGGAARVNAIIPLLASLVERIRECEREHPPEPEYLAWPKERAALQEALARKDRAALEVAGNHDRRIAALQADLEAARTRLSFLNEIGEPDWCGEHPRRFAVDAGQDDEGGTADQCQVCRADAAEATLKEAVGLLREAADWMDDDGCDCGMPGDVPCVLCRIRAFLEILRLQGELADAESPSSPMSLLSGGPK